MTARPGTQWIPVNAVKHLAKLVEKKVLSTDVPLEQLLPEHITKFTAEELHAILKACDDIVIVDSLPPIEQCTQGELLSEVIGFFTAWSPHYYDFINTPTISKYKEHIDRYQRQRLIQVFDRSTVRVPYQTTVAQFNNRQREQAILRWKRKNLLRDGRDAAQSCPTNIIAYLSSSTSPAAIQQNQSLNIPLNATPRYIFPPDITPTRFGLFISALRRVRLSTRINEELICPIGISFFIQDSSSQSTALTRARFNESDIVLEQGKIDSNFELRARLFGLRPHQIYRDGLGPRVLASPKIQPEGELINPVVNLPDCDLVREIKDKWMVMPLVMATNFNNTQNKSSSNVAFWIFPPSLPSQDVVAAAKKTSDPFEFKNNTVLLQVPEHPFDFWKTKVNASKDKHVPIVDAAKLPNFLIQSMISNRSLQIECAYRDASQTHTDKISVGPGEIKDVANWVPPHQFRGCLVIELVRILTEEQILEKVDSKPRLDVPKQDVIIKCPVCKKTDGLSRCSQCREVFYCSAICQRKDWPLHKDSCKQRLIEKEREEKRHANLAQDDDIQIDLNNTSQIVHLECPLSSQRCKIPVRGLHCKHARCFDLKTWVISSSSSGSKSNICPICTVPLLLDDLRISARMEIAIKTIDPRYVEVELGKDDLYHPRVQNKQAADLADSDDDSDGGSNNNSNIQTKVEQIKKSRPNPTTNTTGNDSQQLVQLTTPATTTTAPKPAPDVIELD